MPAKWALLSQANSMSAFSPLARCERRNTANVGSGSPMPRLLVLIAALFTSFFTASCATTMTVSSHVERGLDFAPYRSFDWGPADALPTGDPRLDQDPFFKDHVQGVVEKELAAKGIVLSASGTPDLLIHYHANISPRIDINRLDRERGYCYDDACGVRTVEKEAGTLVLDVIDARTNRLVWRGWAQHSVEDMLRDRDRMEQRINDAVTRMLEQLPTGPAFQSSAISAHIGAH